LKPAGGVPEHEAAVDRGGRLPAAKRRKPGQWLLDGLERAAACPALAGPRDRLLVLLLRESPSREIVDIIESDPALTLAVLRLSNREWTAGTPPICDIPAAVAAVNPRALGAAIRDLATFDSLGRGGAGSAAAHHLRGHGVATLWAVEPLIRDGLARKPDQLRAAAQLHDIGKLVLLHARGSYTTGSEAPACERLLAENRAWGFDHAVIGGVFARRNRLPDSLASLIERHHSDDDDGDVALLRLADSIVHYSAGHPFDAAELTAVAGRCGIAGSRLDSMLADLPRELTGARRIQPSPLSARQTVVLGRLGEGKRYKEIAAELGLAVSTVRSHLHSAYRRLGVPDRTQAVLLASRQGWLPEPSFTAVAARRP
jgi:DNA-binding CsgD family transcriptional regulator